MKQSEKEAEDIPSHVDIPPHSDVDQECVRRHGIMRAPLADIDDFFKKRSRKNTMIQTIQDIPLPDTSVTTTVLWLYCAVIGILGLSGGMQLGHIASAMALPSFRQRYMWDKECMVFLIDPIPEGLTVNDYVEAGINNPDYGSCKEFLVEGGLVLDEDIQEWTNTEEQCVDCCCTNDPAVISEMSFMSACLPIGAAIGSITPLLVPDFIEIDHLLVMSLTSVTQIVGTLTQFGTADIFGMYLGKIICGVGIGLGMVHATCYSVETVPRDFSIAAGAITHGSCGTGFLVAYLLSQYNDGSLMILAGCLIANSLAYVVLQVLPPTPSELIRRNQPLEAIRRELHLNSLGLPSVLALEKKLNSITPHKRLSSREMLHNTLRPVTVMTTLMAMLSHLSGVGVMNVYLVNTFNRYTEYQYAVRYGIYVSLMTAPFTGLPFLLHNLSQRKVLILGSYLMAGGMAASSAIIAADGLLSTGWVCVFFGLSFCVSAVGFLISYGPITNLVPCELFPPSLATRGTGVCSFVGWATLALMNYSFPYLSHKDVMGLSNVLLVYTVACIGCVIYSIRKFHPDTDTHTDFLCGDQLLEINRGISGDISSSLTSSTCSTEDIHFEKITIH